MQEDAEFTVLHGSKERDPDGTKLSATIHAHYAYERMRQIRAGLVYLVAALGICVWPLAAWPQLDAAQFRRVTLALWAVTFAGLVMASIQEYWRFQRRARLLAELHGVQKDG